MGTQGDGMNQVFCKEGCRLVDGLDVSLKEAELLRFLKTRSLQHLCGLTYEMGKMDREASLVGKIQSSVLAVLV